MKKSHNTSFWENLPRPFFALAPMANVTDLVFRKLFAKYGKPDVMWTEFVSADGLISAGQKKLLVDLVYTEKERPIVAQLFTGHPEAMKNAARLIADLGFDGLDINMGCPDRAVQKQGGGAALMQDRKLALAILESAREGIVMSKKGLPVSIKTRLGYGKVDLKWIEYLLEQNLPALTIHLRTRKEMSDVPAHWELMPEIIQMRDKISPKTLIIGNGDVESIEQGREYAEKYGCDGVMIGRGAFGKPWLFRDTMQKRIREGTRKSETEIEEVSREERLGILLEHSRMFHDAYCGRKKVKSFDVMKKHFKAYVSGWGGAKELRTKLMLAMNFKQVKKVIGGGSIHAFTDRSQRSNTHCNH